MYDIKMPVKAMLANLGYPYEEIPDFVEDEMAFNEIHLLADNVYHLHLEKYRAPPNSTVDTYLLRMFGITLSSHDDVQLAWAQVQQQQGIKFPLKYLRDCETLRMYNDIKLNWAQVLHDHRIKTSHDMIQYYIHSWGFLYQQHGGLLIPVPWNITEGIILQEWYAHITSYADSLYNKTDLASLTTRHPCKEIHPPALRAAIWQDVRFRFPTISSMDHLWAKQAPSMVKYYVYMITTAPEFHPPDNQPCFIGFAENLAAALHHHLQNPPAGMMEHCTEQAQAHGRLIPVDEMFRVLLLDITNDKFNASDLQQYYTRYHDTNIHGFNKRDSAIDNHFRQNFRRRQARRRRRLH